MIVHDDLIDSKLHKQVYEWGQSVSWYTKWITALPMPGSTRIPFNEYSPSKHGNFNNRHILGPTNDLNSLHRLTEFVMYRHPIGWNDEMCAMRTPEVWNLWCVINKKLFSNNATLDGVPEPAAGLSGSDSFYDDGEDFYNRYNVPKKNNEWTSMLNARTCEIFDCNIGNRIGQVHKDTSPKVKGSDKHFTVLFVSNLEWYPDWGGELVFYDDEDTGHKHWRRDYNLGWPKDIVGNKPNRVICYRHDETHNTYPTKTNAPEMTQKIAFRVRVK